MARILRSLSVDGVTVTIAFVIMVAYFAIASPFFLSGENIRNLLVEATPIALIAAGLTYVLLAGGIDLSVGGVLGLSAGVAYWGLLQGLPVGVVVLLGITVGAVVGVVNGLVISGLGVNDFIVTLATMSMSFGLLAVLASSVTLAGAASEEFSEIARGAIFAVPTPVIIAVVLLALLEVILIKTPFGRRVYAGGMNPRAAELAGVPVRRVRFEVYVISGAVAGLAGVIQASRLNSVQDGLGSGYELTAIAAAVLGGVSLTGGRGSVWRTVVGALFLVSLSRGLQLLGVDPLWFTIVTGLSIIAAIAFDRIMQRVAASRATSRETPAAPMPPASVSEMTRV
ncbi:MAG: rbsC [Naasia sp.]|jgi:ribose/xylose/arabinose/galactoside ABC-type transport system permease subunit|uniref:ABC transporter permease n=1 Tax=Naasia sp. TaxID=2546198 RepID=UPI00261D0ECD|nr:ABC transporter permease [Naasia sp.]MCU1569439.1 rbsC [Naasia sp.]